MTPEVEFLEIGVKVNSNATTWKAYGPDKSGTYGGLNGIGGLEAIITPTKTYSIVNNFFGHVVATHDGTHMELVPTEVGAFGPLPGSFVLPLSEDRELQDVTHWFGYRVDENGFINMGERVYDYRLGQFISADRYGCFASWNTYAFANNNPLAFADPTRRIATEFARDHQKSAFPAGYKGGPGAMWRGEDISTAQLEARHQPGVIRSGVRVLGAASATTKGIQTLVKWCGKSGQKNIG